MRFLDRLGMTKLVMLSEVEISRFIRVLYEIPRQARNDIIIKLIYDIYEIVVVIKIL